MQAVNGPPEPRTQQRYALLVSVSLNAVLLGCLLFVKCGSSPAPAPMSDRPHTVCYVVQQDYAGTCVHRVEDGDEFEKAVFCTDNPKDTFEVMEKAQLNRCP